MDYKKQLEENIKREGNWNVRMEKLLLTLTEDQAKKSFEWMYGDFEELIKTIKYTQNKSSIDLTGSILQ